MRNILVTLLDIIVSIIAFFLGLRMFLELFAANPATPFVAWIYTISEGLLSPFRGIFPNAAIGRGSVFDTPAFIALVAYTIIFYLIISILDSIFDSIETPIVRRRTYSDPHLHTPGY